MSASLCLSLLLAFPIHGPLMSTCQHSGTTTLPEFQICFLWISEDAHHRAQSLKQTGPSPSVIDPSLPSRNAVPYHTQAKILPVGIRGKGQIVQRSIPLSFVFCFQSTFC